MIDIPSLQGLAHAIPITFRHETSPPARPISIWEITSWILPMAPEHLRRVLAAEPGLPQGSAGAEGGTRWFSPQEVAGLRARFATGGRKARYLPARPINARAALIALTQPRGKAGRSVAALHLATAAALAGYRVLLIDADPAGQQHQALGVAVPSGDGVLAFIARAAGQHLRRVNESRLDRGEEPLPMPEALSAALDLTAADLIRPTRWPGLDLLPAGEGLMQADMQIAGWRSQQRSWRPWRALAEALTADGLRQRYDLILCDTAPGLGPLALSLLASADVLLFPLPLTDTGAGAAFAGGLRQLATAMAALQAEDQRMARALGQNLRPLEWRRVLALPTRAGAETGGRLTGLAAQLGPVMLADPLPELAPLTRGEVANFFDLDYRAIGRLAYAPLRDGCTAAWAGLAAVIADLWAVDTTAQTSLPGL